MKKSPKLCRSIASSGLLKCALELDHAGAHTSKPPGKKLAQYGTWRIGDDGRFVVTTFSGKKKMAEWLEDAPACRPQLCPSCGGVQCKPGGCLYALRAAAPNLADRCPKCGYELGEHDGKKCPKPAKASRPVALEDEPETDGPEPDEVTPVTKLTKLTKIGTHEVHPAAALFPMIAEAEWPSFVADIGQNGQRKPIVRIGEQILDGRNRLRACLELGLVPKFRAFGDETSDGIDPISFVVSENIHRRHLNETQRAFVGAELVPMYEAQAKERMLAGKKDPTPNSAQGEAVALAAQAVNVGKTSVKAAMTVNRDAAQEVIAAAKDRGELKVSAAAELATLPKQKQREIVEKMGRGEMRAGKVRAHVNQEKKRAVVRKINEQNVSPMPVGPFRVIVVDWPWPYENSDQHEGSRGHIPYPSMSIEQALAMTDELEKLAHEDGCILGFWTTNAFMPDAVRIVEAWGFSWRTIRTWDKGRDGIGTWCRSRTEHLIIAERGEVEHTLNEISTLIDEARREHSRKSDEPMESFAKHCPGPHLEMFAREPRDGWARWGAESNKFASEAA